MIRVCVQIVTNKNKSLAIGFSKADAIAALTAETVSYNYGAARRNIVGKLRIGEYRFVAFKLDFKGE
jgi:hypothetical protein